MQADKVQLSEELDVQMSWVVRSVISEITECF